MVMSRKGSLRVTNLDIYEVDYLCAVFFDTNYNPLRIVQIQNVHFPSSDFRFVLRLCLEEVFAGPGGVIGLEGVHGDAGVSLFLHPAGELGS